MELFQIEKDLPSDVLRALSTRYHMNVESVEFAKKMDELDPLAHLRERFCYPKKCDLSGTDKDLIGDSDEECIYLCGNSLGLKPKSTDKHVQMQLDKWAKKAVEVHFEEPLPAFLCDLYGRDEMGRLVGAEPSSLILMNGLTVNLNLLFISFYQPTNTRYKILIEKQAFSSDRYAVRSQAAIKGFDPDLAVLEIGPREGEDILRTQDILEFLAKEGSSIAVICLGGVQYYTGQKFDMDIITKAAHEQGIVVGWDLAHAVGNVKIELDKWDVDFACWCTYKYLNSGAGCIAGAYVNAKHDSRTAPNLNGWYSNKQETAFEMRDKCDFAPGIKRFRLCNPPPLLVACVMASLEIFEEAGLDKLLQKQFLLTGFLELLMDCNFQSISPDNIPLVRIITPRNPKERGCQLSMAFAIPIMEVHDKLTKLGIVCDVRKPNVLRIAPAPLYNSFLDVFKFVSILRKFLEENKHQSHYY